jgi:hypothetical protein
MKLSQFVAQTKRDLWDDLKSGRDPRVGRFDSAVLADGRTKGEPQIGAANFTPTTITFEYIFSDGRGATTILSVVLDAPERIVFLPVPGWVVETIWQGEIDGSYHFEQDALAALDQFRGMLTPDANLVWFGPRQATRRE